MAGGQQIVGSQGVIIALGGANNVAATGSAWTAAAGTTAPTESIPLRSRKVGTGTAAPVLTGLISSVGTGTLLYQGQASVAWNANSEPDLAHYRVYHGLTAINLNESVDVGLVTTYVWSGLTPGTTHYFAVTAFDTSGNQSNLSAVVSKAY